MIENIQDILQISSYQKTSINRINLVQMLGECASVYVFTEKLLKVGELESQLVAFLLV